MSCRSCPVVPNLHTCTKFIYYVIILHVQSIPLTAPATADYSLSSLLSTAECPSSKLKDSKQYALHSTALSCTALSSGSATSYSLDYSCMDRNGPCMTMSPGSIILWIGK